MSKPTENWGVDAPTVVKMATELMTASYVLDTHNKDILRVIKMLPEDLRNYAWDEWASVTSMSEEERGRIRKVYGLDRGDPDDDDIPF